MKIKILILVIAVLSGLLLSCSKQPATILVLEEGWKFNTGDHPCWAEPSYADTAWQDFSTGKFWDDQGYETYDGYAWYRIHVTIPSSLRKGSYFSDSLVIFLGKIDDNDQVYLNGRLVGENGKSYGPNTEFNELIPDIRDAWQMERRYVLSANDERINWDRENVIAVRVYDSGGGGGMYAGKAYIRMRDVGDYIDLNLRRYYPFTIKNQTDYNKKLALINHSNQYDFSGILHIEVVDRDRLSTVHKEKIMVDITRGKELIYDINFSNPEQALGQLICTFKPKGSANCFSEEIEVPYILTPALPLRPRINGARIYGARPHNPFLYRIPASGKRPIIFSAEGLPEGLILDSNSGSITGAITTEGTYQVILTAKNELGQDTLTWTIVAGYTLALTPPLGWNSYNAWGFIVDEEKVREAADAFVNKGLADHGWTYVNIDDGWETPERLPDGSITGNEKFPDFPGLAEYVHGKGLKLGIYSSPGPTTCGNYMGSYLHESQDAATWADWGIDYLKYDWCTYGDIAIDTSLPELQKPFILMRRALDSVNRDIVYSICPHGLPRVVKWGAEVGANLWRTAYDINDSWRSMSINGFNHNGASPYSSPGHWNDPDMLLVGWLGWGRFHEPTSLSADEQYTHISLWCLLSAPLLLGCDMTQLDDFTVSLLTNDEVLAVDQDQLGRQADKYFDNGNIQYWMKPLYDGSYAAGIFNLNEDRQPVNIKFADLELTGSYSVRDLWRQEEMGVFGGGMNISVPGHGVVLVKLTRR
jgi:hypothetical protein